MGKAIELLDEIKKTEKEVAEATGVTPQFIYLVKKGERKGIGWGKRLADFARKQAAKLEELAEELEPDVEAA